MVMTEEEGRRLISEYLAEIGRRGGKACRGDAKRIAGAKGGRAGRGKTKPRNQSLVRT